MALSYDQFLQVAELLPEAMLLVSADGTILAANQAVEKQLALVPKEICGRRLADLAESPDSVALYLRGCSRSKELLPGSLVFQAPSGEGLPRRAEGAVFRPRRDDEPALILLRLTAKETAAKQFLVLNQKIEELSREVQQRKKTQGLLEESEQRFRQLAEHITDVFWISDPGMGRVLYISPAFEQIWGMSCQSLYEQPSSFLDSVHEEDRQQVIDSLERQALGEATVTEYRVIWPDGSVSWILDRGFPIKDGRGRVYRACGIAEDFTKRKLSEASLREHNERLRLLGNVAIHLLTVHDPEEMFRGLFERIKHHFDLDAYFNFLVEESGDAVRLESYDGVPQQVAEKLDRMEFGQGICGTIPPHHNDPAAQFVKNLGFRAYACFPLIVEGRPLGTLSFGSRRRDGFDDQDVEFLQTITRYVTVAYERLQLFLQIQEADWRKDEFLAMLGHELRNPLATITTAIAILKEPDLFDQDAVRESIDILERQANHLNRLVGDLLEVTRISRGIIQLKREEVDVASVAREVARDYKPVCDSRGLTLELNVLHEPVYMWGIEID
jgi:PAS domain S-box-containing protein